MGVEWAGGKRLRKTRFKPARFIPTIKATVPVRDKSYRKRRHERLEQVRMAAKNEAEAVDRRLRSGVEKVGADPRESWGLEDGKVPVTRWQRVASTIRGMIPAWPSQRRK